MENKKYVTGIDQGGTKILIGNVTVDGEVLIEKRYPMDRSTRETSLASLYNAAEDFLSNQSADYAPIAVGVGLVGHIDFKKGIWVNSMNIPIRSPEPVADKLKKIFGVPVFCDNDVHSAAIAELKLGAGKKYDDFIYLSVGTGMAAGVISDGKLIRGAANYAGEIGHFYSGDDSVPCVCGRKGCIEAMCSGGGLIGEARRLMPEYPSTVLSRYDAEGRLHSHSIFDAASEGDELAKFLTDRAVRVLGNMLADTINLLNPPAVVFGGGVFTHPFYLPAVRDYALAHATPVSRSAVKEMFVSELDAAKLGLIGAAMVALDGLER